MNNSKLISIIHSGTNGSIAEHWNWSRPHAFMSPVELHGTPYIYLAKGSLSSDCKWRDLDIGTWMSFELDPNNHGHDKPRAINAHALEVTQEDLMERLRQRYNCVGSMNKNYGSLRLDGLSMQEAKKIAKCGAMSDEAYYAFMSENGLRSTSKSYDVEFNPGDRLETARRIVEAIERKESR